MSALKHCCGVIHLYQQYTCTSSIPVTILVSLANSGHNTDIFQNCTVSVKSTMKFNDSVLRTIYVLNTSV